MALFCHSSWESFMLHRPNLVCDLCWSLLSYVKIYLSLLLRSLNSLNPLFTKVLFAFDWSYSEIKIALESPLLAHKIWLLSMNTITQVVPLNIASIRDRLSSRFSVCLKASFMWLSLIFWFSWENQYSDKTFDCFFEGYSFSDWIYVSSLL